MKRSIRPLTFVLSMACAWLAITDRQLQADPCGMVPPIRLESSRIVRVGHQRTYVFHRRGIETFIIKPGFEGTVEDFGMLIPFPKPPSVRKVPDDVFEQLANAVDPPEVVVDLRVFQGFGGGGLGGGGGGFGGGGGMGMSLRRDEVRVVREEAVGMYEVAVLQAGSSEALQRWMKQHQYIFPKGMDTVADEYIEDGWCFVAVKTRVAAQLSVEPQPGQRSAKAELPKGSVYDGYVQAMGFRFPSKELVLPMRLSAFNKGDLRNVIYLLTDTPQKVKQLPKEFVVRQISGEQLIKNITEPLPLRVLGGKYEDIPNWQLDQLKTLRDPTDATQVALELFASDIQAAAKRELTLPHEELAKELLQVDEFFGLRGVEMDQLHRDVLMKDQRRRMIRSLETMRKMTLTVIDGDFPRDVLASTNLTFSDYRMPRAKNRKELYDAKSFGKPDPREGNLYIGRRAVGDDSIERVAIHNSAENDSSKNSSTSGTRREMDHAGAALLAIAGLLGAMALLRSSGPRWRSAAAATMLLVVLVAATGLSRADPNMALAVAIRSLGSDKNDQAMAALVEHARHSDDRRERTVEMLTRVADRHESLPRRGWAIAVLSQIGGQDIDEALLEIHSADYQPALVRTWAAAARLKMVQSNAALLEKSAILLPQFPAVRRPVSQRILNSMAEDGHNSCEDLIAATQSDPSLAGLLGDAILDHGSRELARVMIQAKKIEIRRRAAAFLGTLAAQGDRSVPATVIAELTFDADAESVPWGKGALFLPALNWKQADARELIDNLIAWHLWCDVHGHVEGQLQVHNNLINWGLANAAGYRPTVTQRTDTMGWLRAWGKVVGRRGIEKILKAQNLHEDPEYTALMNELPGKDD